MASFEELDEGTVRKLAQTSFALLGDKDTSKAFKKLIKQKNPEYRDPEIELEGRVQEALEPLQEKLKAIEEERAKERFSAEREQAKARVEARGLDFDKIEKFAQEKQIASYETAADYFQMESQMATPSTPGAAFARPPEEVSKFINNPAKLREHSRQVAYAAINEINRGKRAF